MDAPEEKKDQLITDQNQSEEMGGNKTQLNEKMGNVNLKLNCQILACFIFEINTL